MSSPHTLRLPRLIIPAEPEDVHTSPLGDQLSSCHSAPQNSPCAELHLVWLVIKKKKIPQNCVHYIFIYNLEHYTKILCLYIIKTNIKNYVFCILYFISYILYLMSYILSYFLYLISYILLLHLISYILYYVDYRS